MIPASSASATSTKEDHATASPKSPVATYQNIPGARFGKRGPPWTIECATTFPKISKTPVRMCSLLYKGLSLPSGPVKSRKFSVS